MPHVHNIAIVKVSTNANYTDSSLTKYVVWYYAILDTFKVFSNFNIIIICCQNIYRALYGVIR